MQGLAALARIETADMRAWMALTRSHGVGARSLARKLSAVKGFYRWLAAREGFEPTSVLSIRAPKFQPKLPRPLSPEAAQEVIATLDMQSSQALDCRARSGGCDAALRLRPAHIRGARADRRGRADGGHAADHRQGRQGAAGAGHRARARRGGALCADLPVRHHPRRAAVFRRAGRGARGAGGAEGGGARARSLVCRRRRHRTRCATALPRIC